MGLKSRIGLATFMLVSLIGSGVRPAGNSPRAEHLLIQIEMQANEFRVVKTAVVELQIPKRRNQHRTWPWRLVIKSKKGRELYRAGLRDPTELRGEFANPDDPGKIDGHHLKHEGPVSFSIRVPLVAGSRIEFYALRPDLRRTPNPPDEAYQLLGSTTCTGPGQAR